MAAHNQVAASVGIVVALQGDRPVDIAASKVGKLVDIVASPVGRLRRVACCPPVRSGYHN